MPLLKCVCFNYSLHKHNESLVEILIYFDMNILSRTHTQFEYICSTIKHCPGLRHPQHGYVDFCTSHPVPL